MSALPFKTKDENKILAEDALIFAKKKFMTTKFNDNSGAVIPCTVLEIEPNYITGYCNYENKKLVSISGIHDKGGSEKSIINRIGKPALGLAKKIGVKPTRRSSAFKTKVEEELTSSIGDPIYADIFESKEYLDVFGTSKGKGYQGVMKLHGMAGGPASHGSSRFHRGRGSVGTGRSTPGRCFKNTKMASRMGGNSVVAENVKILDVLRNEDLSIGAPVVPGTMWILVKGSIPGSNGSIVKIRAAKKK